MAKKKGKGDGKKDGKKDAKAKAVEPKPQPQPLKEARGTTTQHNEFITDLDGEVAPGLRGALEHARGGLADAAFGTDIMTEGMHTFRVDVVKSGSVTGAAYGIVVGVADATEGIRLTDSYGGPAWGLHLSSARFTSTLDSYERGYLGEPALSAERDGTTTSACRGGEESPPHTQQTRQAHVAKDFVHTPPLRTASPFALISPQYKLKL